MANYMGDKIYQGVTILFNDFSNKTTDYHICIQTNDCVLILRGVRLYQHLIICAILPTRTGTVTINFSQSSLFSLGVVGPVTSITITNYGSITLME